MTYRIIAIVMIVLFTILAIMFTNPSQNINTEGIYIIDYSFGVYYD